MPIEFYAKTVHEDPLLDKGWVAITDYYVRKRNYQKALYHINKAIGIDSENVVYWKSYAKINKRLGYLEEAEQGYRRAIELGNYELETWLSRADLLHQIGEIAAAIQTLHQALEFYPDHAEVLFRIGGLYLKENQLEKSAFYLENAFKTDKEFVIILEELFPNELQSAIVQNIAKRFS